MRLPDFVVIGAMKCGTSTLAHQLGLQAGVFMTEPKEPNFFSDDAIFAKGMEWYTDLFRDAPEGALLGEASTHYTKLPTHPLATERMAAQVPDAKLIYMVREPVSRSLSQLRHHWTERKASQDFEREVRQIPELLAYSRYHEQISAWRRHYTDENILVVALERLHAQPHEEFDRVLRFLGMEGAWVEDTGNQNEGAARSRDFPLHSLLIGNPVMTALRRALIPQSLRQFVYRQRQISAPSVSDDARLYLADGVRDDMTAFGQLVGLDGLTPENFKEKVLSQQLSLVSESVDT
ncbi:MAG: sulfotransferase domain-containing protein [Pseudomonadota bacterium]